MPLVECGLLGPGIGNCDARLVAQSREWQAEMGSKATQESKAKAKAALKAKAKAVSKAKAESKAKAKLEAEADAKRRLKARTDANAKLMTVMKDDGMWEALPVPIKERCRCYCKGDGCRVLEFKQRRCSLAKAARQLHLCPNFEHLHLCERCFSTDFCTSPPGWQCLLNLQRI